MAAESRSLNRTEANVKNTDDLPLVAHNTKNGQALVEQADKYALRQQMWATNISRL